MAKNNESPGDNKATALAVGSKKPEQWARDLGFFQAGNPLTPEQGDNFAPAHAAAHVLHKWPEPSQNQGSATFELSESDYRQALRNALAYPCELRHGPAVPAGTPPDLTIKRARRAKDSKEAKAKGLAKREAEQSLLEMQWKLRREDERDLTLKAQAALRKAINFGRTQESDAASGARKAQA